MTTVTAYQLVVAWVGDRRRDDGGPPVSDADPVTVREAHNALLALAGRRVRDQYTARLAAGPTEEGVS